MTGAPRGKAADDRGTSLAEVSVAAVLAGAFLVVLAAVLLGTVRSQGHLEDRSAAQAATRNAFLVLDKQVRYADVVTAPATVGGSEWIEWRLHDPELPIAQSPTQSRCYQWRADAATGRLAYRSWVVPAAPNAATPSGWVTVARDLQLGSGPVFTTDSGALRTAPFALPAAAASSGRQFVGIVLGSTGGSDRSLSSAVTVFTAINSTNPPPPGAFCAEVPRS